MEARKHWFSTFGGVEVGMGRVRRGEVKQVIRFWRQKQGQVMMGSQPFGGLWGHDVAQRVAISLAVPLSSKARAEGSP